MTAAWLDGVSPAARDAAQTLALTLGPAGPYTWRLLHCGRRRDDPAEAARGVAEAAASLPLAVAGFPSYAVSLPELKAALDPPLHGHSELVAVMRGWPRCADLSTPPTRASTWRPTNGWPAPRSHRCPCAVPRSRSPAR
ncbi:hypothetical protein ACFQ0B_06490 [Nonomuraea thailandensis]